MEDLQTKPEPFLLTLVFCSAVGKSILKQFCIYYRFSVSITVRGYSQGILILNIFSLTFKFVWCSVFVLLDLTILFFLFHELEGKPLFKDSSRKL